ncbi:uncharacterized protein FIESC28_09767 [Fusarium coffeatum]|uniref:Uncharacterized protein n=1 Tax=Fusarium coffeatum TaxID=231269 RepID=A0A366R0C4_9HYPO|nr:uncharacterized protein FIESC28_09767 [Fusarium coffeatum]RBR09655.1 hypothetical protein FIESC28_09767 [Fusarium coffeatum]
MNDQRRTFNPAAVPSVEVLFGQQDDVLAKKVRWTVRKLLEMKQTRSRALVVTRDDTSASTYAEVTSVLTFPNQVDKPVWEIALVNETLDVVEEAALTRSGAASFIPNQQVHPFLRAQHKVIHAFYLVAQCMGKDHNHLPQCRTH